MHPMWHQIIYLTQQCVCATRDIEYTHKTWKYVFLPLRSNIAYLCKPSYLTSYIYKFPGRLDHILKLLLSSVLSSQFRVFCCDHAP